MFALNKRGCLIVTHPIALKKSTALFLQGPPSLFWPDLAQSFQEKGWDVLKIHLAPSDVLFWRGDADACFSGGLEEWAAYLRRFLAERQVTHVFLYADRQPYHRICSEICAEKSIRVFVIENGYLRPDWITCEEGGMGRFSRFPKHADVIRAIAKASPQPNLEVEHRHPFAAEAWREVAFHLTNGVTPRALWRFDHDRYYHPLVDYGAWILRLAKAPLARRHAHRVATRLLIGERPFFFAPLQLQSDYSIRDGSPFGHLSEMIEQVVDSFARNAPKRTHLLFKTHPHDNGLEGWSRIAAQAARRHRVGRRVHVVDGGPFGSFVSSARGVIVANSTSGLHAIRSMKPTIALADAVYDVPGLTHQRGLDSFWTDPDPIDSSLARDFVAALAARTQVKGSFFCPEGRARASAEIAARVAGEGVVSIKAREIAELRPLSGAAWTTRRPAVTQA